MITLERKGENYLLTRAFPKEHKLKPLELVFDSWEKLQYWLDKESPNIFNKKYVPPTEKEIERYFRK